MFIMTLFGTDPDPVTKNAIACHSIVMKQRPVDVQLSQFSSFDSNISRMFTEKHTIDQKIFV